MAMCAGVQKLSRPMERCQETSQWAPMVTEVTASAAHHRYHGMRGSFPRGLAAARVAIRRFPPWGDGDRIQLAADAHRHFAAIRFRQSTCGGFRETFRRVGGWAVCSCRLGAADGRVVDAMGGADGP